MKYILLKDCQLMFPSPDPKAITTKQSILVEGRMIVALGEFSTLMRDHIKTGDEVEFIDCSRKIVMPGFVDSHNHLLNTHMVLARAILSKQGADKEDIGSRFLSIIHDPYGWLSKESLYDISKASLLNAIKHGATTVENSTIMPEMAYSLMKEVGIRGILAGQIATSFRLSNDDLPWRHMIERTERNIKDFHDPCDGRMSVVVHIHDFWDTLEVAMLAGMELAHMYDTKYVSHFWEFQDPLEKTDLLWRDQGGSFERYWKIGLINDRCVFFHGSVLDEPTIDLLSETDASIIHNPDINGTNCGNCAYIPYMLKKGINVGLGSDYGSLDMLTAMKLMLFAHNIMPREHKGLAPTAPFRAATLGGAKAYGLDHLIGTIEPGKRADIITFDLECATELLPICTSLLDYDPELLFFIFTRNCAGLKTAETIIDGDLIRKNGEFIDFDECEVTSKATNWIERFLPELTAMHRKNRHYYRVVHANYVKDEHVSQDILDGFDY